MKCPLQQMEWHPQSDTKKWDLRDCFKEECAWWEEKDGQCSIKVMAEFIAGMGHNVTRIADQLPREFTPRST